MIQRRAFVLGILGAFIAAPAMALPMMAPMSQAKSPGEPALEEARAGRGRGWGRGGNPHPRGRARRVRRGWYRSRRVHWYRAPRRRWSRVRRYRAW